MTLSEICKFLRYVSPQIANPQIFLISPQIANLQINTVQNTAQLCLETVLKVVFLHEFLKLELYIVNSNEKKYVFEDLRKF
jgi:hypothetical protein